MNEEMDNANKDMIKPMLDAKKGLENMVSDLFVPSVAKIDKKEEFKQKIKEFQKKEEDWQGETRQKITRDCPDCKSKDEIVINPDYIGFTIFCDGCYDCEIIVGGEPHVQYVPECFVAWGKTEEESIRDWNDHEE